METFQKSAYIGELERSSHPVTVTPMSVVDVQHVFLRFQLNRATFANLSAFVYSPSMDIGAFIDANHVDIRELSVHAAELGRVAP